MIPKDDFHVKGNDRNWSDFKISYWTDSFHGGIDVMDAKVNEVIGFLQFFIAATVKHKNMPILLKSQNEGNQNRARKYPQNTYMK